MKIRYALSMLALTALTVTPALGACPPAGYDHARLTALKADEFKVDDDVQRNTLALALTACLADPDPDLRDRIAFGAYHIWLRGKALTTDTMLALAADLEARLVAPEGPGFERPFAALVLSELARADRIEAYLPPARRTQLLEASLEWFTGVRDYRGFDEPEGWRHSVAHGADLLLQLGLNPAFGRDELVRIRDAVVRQIAPPGHFYIYGESERLAAPIIFIARRSVFSAEDWSAWFAQFAEPTQWENAYWSQTGLAKRHDTMAFLSAVYVNARISEDAADNALLPGVEVALKAMP
jgi:Protein of unknown function (DUF2785)